MSEVTSRPVARLLRRSRGADAPTVDRHVALRPSGPGETRTQENRLKERPVAGIVIFRPDIILLQSLVSAISAEVRSVIIIANSAISAREEALLRTAAGLTQVVYEEHADNIGLAAAYTRIAALAERHGAAEIILFDQDSSPAPGTITRLSAVMDELRRSGVKPAVIGPRPVSPGTPGDTHKSPTLHLHKPDTPIGGARPVWFLISSGSLISMEALRHIGSFEADFFIDAIDVEWCMRAWSRGYSCWVAQDLRMAHRLGAGLTKIAWPPWSFTLQPAWRLSLYARNQANLLLRPYVPTRWKVRWFAYFLCQTVIFLIVDKGKLARSKALVRGFFAGIRGRLGPPASKP